MRKTGNLVEIGHVIATLRGFQIEHVVQEKPRVRVQGPIIVASNTDAQRNGATGTAEQKVQHRRAAKATMGPRTGEPHELAVHPARRVGITRRGRNLPARGDLQPSFEPCERCDLQQRRNDRHRCGGAYAPCEWNGAAQRSPTSSNFASPHRSRKRRTLCSATSLVTS